MILSPWSVKSSPRVNHLRDIVHDGAGYVIVGTGFIVLTSLDGNIWADRSHSVSGAGTFHLSEGGGVLCYWQSNISTVSSDGGVNWTGHATGITTGAALDMDRAGENGRFVAVGLGGGSGGSTANSPDGETGWTEVTSPLIHALRGVASNFDGSVVVACGDDTGIDGNGPYIVRSVDQGQSWTTIDPNISGTSAIYGVCHTGTHFIGVGTLGTIIKSPDGLTWTEKISPITSTLLNRVHGTDSLLVAVGNDQGSGKGPLIIYSEDAGETWIEAPTLEVFENLRGVAVNGCDVVVIGDSNGVQGTIAFSTQKVSNKDFNPASMGDVLLCQTPDDGEINAEGGIIELTTSFETSTYLSLFGGNMSGDWWGNQGIQDQAFKQISRTQEIIDGMPLTTGNLVKLKEAVESDLKWMKDKSIASNIGVIITIPGLNKVKISIIIKAEGKISEFTFTENWLSK